MKVEQNADSVCVSIEEDDINRRLVTEKDPISRLHWLKLLLLSITHDELQRVRDFMENQGPGMAYLDFVGKAIVDIVPINAAMEAERNKPAPGLFRDEDVIR